MLFTLFNFTEIGNGYLKRIILPSRFFNMNVKYLTNPILVMLYIRWKKVYIHPAIMKIINIIIRVDKPGKNAIRVFVRNSNNLYTSTVGLIFDFIFILTSRKTNRQKEQKGRNKYKFCFLIHR